VESLSDEFDLVDIALAAVSLVDAEARGAEDATELAPATLPAMDRPDRGAGGPRGAGTRPRYGQERHGAFVPRSRVSRPEPGEAGDRGTARDGASAAAHRPHGTGPASDRVQAGPRKGYRATAWRDTDGRPVLRPPRGTTPEGAGGADAGGVTRLFVGAGRAAGMRPGDLVGAITNEAGLRGNDIGAIQIADGFSLVEVPEAAAEHVIRSLRDATIRGQKVNVRRERY
jgi:hypothetical protein